ncbi:MAG: hypothetical protein J6T10_21535 [Methanobrevibacter sp.]|nr:hypothetical protein [Methanobrevibacter sp.]
MNNPDFKKLVLLSMQTLTNFPYIEEDFDALTNYELLCKVVEEMNKVIENQNTTNQSVIELYNAFNILKTFVDNYFENLNVQTEINHKLDEMAEDGSLLLLIKNYVDPIYQAYEDDINAEVNRIKAQVDGLASGSPLPASSTADMTETDRVYVNTSDGYLYYYDGTEWVQGWVYQATEDSTTLTNLVDTVNHIGEVNANLYVEDDDTHMNYYYSENTETHLLETNSDSTFWCGIVKIDGAGDYTLTSSGYNLYRLDADKKVINKVTATGSPKTITCSASTKYLGFSCKKARALPENFMVVKSDSLPETYIPYGFTLKDYIPLTETQKTEIAELVPDAEEKYVVASSGGDYTGIIEALTDLQGNENKKTITIMPGIYDLFEEYGGSEWHQAEENQTKNYHELCPFVPKNTTIVGVGEVVLRYRPTSSETTHHMCVQISPLNIQETCSIKNIKIDCDYCRYAIHIETGSDYINENILLENLNIKKLNNDGYPQAVGCGGTTGTVLTVNNCYIRGSLGSFSIHENGQNGQNGMNIFLKDSTFVKTSSDTTRFALRFSCTRQDNSHNVYINNCYFNNLSLSYESGQSLAKNKYNIIVTNCNNYDLDYNYNFDNENQILNYNTSILSITNRGTGNYN